jgi:outer membrane protein OmpA-like peptidoglycan-associated protein
MLEREIKCAARAATGGTLTIISARETPTTRLVSIVVLGCACAATVRADPPALMDSQSIVRSLAPSADVHTRGFTVEPRTSAAASSAGGERKIALDIRFGNDSNQLTPAAHGQLEQLGTALNSPELAGKRFRIAGHTSASGAAEHNRQLSESRARAVRSYLIERCGIAPGRLEAVGFGADRPLPEYPANALQQRRVEISTLPPTS